MPAPASIRAARAMACVSMYSRLVAGLRSRIVMSKTQVLEWRQAFAAQLGSTPGAAHRLSAAIHSTVEFLYARALGHPTFAARRRVAFTTWR